MQANTQNVADYAHNSTLCLFPLHLLYLEAIFLSIHKKLNYSLGLLQYCMYHYLTSSLFDGHLGCYHSFDSASILTRWKNKQEIGTHVGRAVWLTLREVKGPK